MNWLSSLFGPGPRHTLQTLVRKKDVAGPDTLSADVALMQGKWSVIDDWLEGVDAVKAAGQKYLPQFHNEPAAEYARRLASAPFRPAFTSALESICAKPFTSAVVLAGKPSERMKRFAYDVDSCGSSLDVFAQALFASGVSHGIAAFLVDYTAILPRADGHPRSIAEERAIGARPYWVRIPVRDLIDVRLKMVNGRERCTHLRFRSCSSVHDGYSEEVVEQIFEYDVASNDAVYFKVHQRTTNAWEVVRSGRATITEIPLVVFRTGERIGAVAVRFWAHGLAIMAIEYFRSLSRSNEIATFSGWPSLVIKGMREPGDKSAQPEITVGPRTVFNVGADGDAKYEGPDAALVAEVAKDPERVADAFSKLAMEPTLPKSHTSATSAAIDNSRAHSAIQRWAIGLNDALNNGLRFTSMWLGESDETTAVVPTDFVAQVGPNEDARIIGDAQKRGVLSAKTERAELKRRGILAPDWDENAETLQLAIEQEGLEPEELIDPTSGESIVRASNDDGRDDDTGLRRILRAEAA